MAWNSPPTAYEMQEQSTPADGVYILEQIGDMEPTCPRCGNANAMLNGKEWDYELQARSKVCRDCGFTVLPGDYIIKHKEGHTEYTETPFEEFEEKIRELEEMIDQAETSYYEVRAEHYNETALYGDSWPGAQIQLSEMAQGIEEMIAERERLVGPIGPEEGHNEETGV